MTHDSAVTAVAEALCWPAHPGYKPGGCEPCRERAYIAVSAARPIIEAEVRERIAAVYDEKARTMHAEYERGLFRYGSAIEPGSRDVFLEAAIDACDTAARIARGTA